jgi:hypothetical protein
MSLAATRRFYEVTMFDLTSRYANLPVLTLEREGQDPMPFVARRFLPAGSSLQTLAEEIVQSDDRADLITTRTLGDPLQFWRLADANDVLDPGELTDESGQRIRIPIPQP